MNNNHNNPIIMCYSTFTLFIIFIFFIYKILFSYSKNTPPSPPKLPIIGNLHQLGSLPHRTLQHLSNRYGPLMLLHFGSVPVLVVSSPDAAREIMKHHDLVFSHRAKSSMADLLFYGSKDVAFTPYGEYWRQVRSICVLHLLSNRRDMLTGGTHTTFTLMDWTMSELMKNPKVMKKLQNEIREKFKSNDDIEKLQYLKAVIKESLRLHSPLPLLVPHKASKDVEVMGFHVAAGTEVLVNAWAIGRDPKVWENPEEFKPERFLDRDVDYRGMHFELIPFGAGRRGCPGIAFATTSAELVLATLVREFDFALLEEEELDMSEKNGIAVSKKVPLLLYAFPMVS